MSPTVLWLACAVLGMAAALLSGSLGLGAALIALLLATPIVLRGDRLAAVSGLLVGFGALWLALLATQGASGGTTAQIEGWILVGAAPLAIGLIAFALRIARMRPSRDIQRR